MLDTSGVHSLEVHHCGARARALTLITHGFQVRPFSSIKQVWMSHRFRQYLSLQFSPFSLSPVLLTNKKKHK